MRPRAADLDSIPVGIPQMAGAPESLYVWLENQEIVALIRHTLWQPDVQEKNQLLMLGFEIRCTKTFRSGPIKTFHFL